MIHRLPPLLSFNVGSFYDIWQTWAALRIRGGVDCLPTYPTMLSSSNICLGVKAPAWRPVQSPLRCHACARLTHCCMLRTHIHPPHPNHACTPQGNFTISISSTTIADAWGSGGPRPGCLDNSGDGRYASDRCVALQATGLMSRPECCVGDDTAAGYHSMRRMTFSYHVRLPRHQYASGTCF